MDGYLIHCNDFTAGLFDFSSLLQKVPKARFCDLGVGCKDAHSIEFGGWVCFCRELAPNDLVFMETGHVGLFLSASSLLVMGEQRKMIRQAAGTLGVTASLLRPNFYYVISRVQPYHAEYKIITPFN